MFHKITVRLFFLWIFLTAGVFSVSAQEKKQAPTSAGLFKEIKMMDSILFQAFNTQNMAAFKPLFTKDLEWFQDNGGLITYKKVFENFDNTFKKDYKLTR